MVKIVINQCFGGFGLSDAAYEKLIEWGIPLGEYKEFPIDEKTGLRQGVSENEGKILLIGACYCDVWIHRSSARVHPLLVRVVEELGEKANGQLAELKVIEIPDDVDWIIDEHDGMEEVREKARSWS